MLVLVNDNPCQLVVDNLMETDNKIESSEIEVTDFQVHTPRSCAPLNQAFMSDHLESRFARI